MLSRCGKHYCCVRFAHGLGWLGYLGVIAATRFTMSLNRKPWESYEHGQTMFTLSNLYLTTVGPDHPEFLSITDLQCVKISIISFPFFSCYATRFLDDLDTYRAEMDLPGASAEEVHDKCREIAASLSQSEDTCLLNFLGLT